jgi:hypothetical protein
MVSATPPVSPLNGEPNSRMPDVLAGPRSIIPAERRRQPHRLGHDATRGGASDFGFRHRHDWDDSQELPPNLTFVVQEPGESGDRNAAMRTVGRQITPWPQWITCSTVNGSQPPVLVTRDAGEGSTFSASNSDGIS